MFNTKTSRALITVAALGLGLSALTPAFGAQKDVVVSEVAWMGTAASSYDEWMELANNTGTDIDLNGWVLRSADGTPSITLSGIIPAHGRFLLERTDDTSVPDLAADLIYATGAGSLYSKHDQLCASGIPVKI
jgi:hypothetical protein